MRGRESISLELNRVSAVTITVTFLSIPKRNAPCCSEPQHKERVKGGIILHASHWCSQANQPSTVMRQGQILLKIRCEFNGSNSAVYTAALL
jgi:hypothetical protein